MRHETCNANGHGMACNGRIPTSAVSQDTMGRIPPRRQQPRASVKILNVSFSNKFGLYRRQNLAQTPNGDCTIEKYDAKKIWEVLKKSLFL